MNLSTLVRRLDGVAALAAMPFALTAAHLGLVTAAAAVPSRRARSASAGPSHRFAIVVPAHDEEHGIAATLACLDALRYPAELVTTIVVADNCRDRTAEVAAAHGATVIRRDDPDRVGKGFALGAGMRRALADPGIDAVVVIDADTVVDEHLLAEASAALHGGAEVVQADYRVRDPFRSWRTVLMEIAFTGMHTVRGNGRERLGLSVGLRGNGMVFTRAALLAVPYSSVGLVEDVEHAARLAQAGWRVAGLPSATVRGDMPAGACGARRQRQRWEGGRRQLRRQLGWPLLRTALRRGDAVAADVALDVLAPPLAKTTSAGALALVVGLACRAAGQPRNRSLWAAAVILVPVGVHVALAWRRSQTGVKGLGALAHAPYFVLWKLTGAARGGPASWERTERDSEKSAA